MEIDLINSIVREIANLPETERIEAINDLKLKLHEISPFKNEPVDCVIWVKNENVIANDYNPNKVAPPEMELLSVSIEEDGYTQPIVTMDENSLFTVIDGFHRNKVGKENPKIQERICGYLPITVIRDDREGRCDRIASTVRHNRARGKHTIAGMTDIIVELKRRNWSSEKIGKELGMDADEILRLAQISGLAEIFKDREFSKAWEIDKEDLNEIEEINE